MSARARLAGRWSRARGVAAPLVVAAAVASLFLSVQRIELALSVPGPLRILMTALVTAGLLAPMLLGGSPGGAWWRRAVAACAASWPAFVPLLALSTPLPSALPLGVAWLVSAWLRAREGQALSRRVELLAGAALVLAACLLYVLIGLQARGHLDNDAFYYFGVARHMVRTGRYEEPLVWQFIAPASSLIHRPFDYWHGLTSLLLVPPLAIFGPSHRVALLTMALVSCVGLAAFWALLDRALPQAPWLARLVAFFGFAFAPGSAGYRFDTETVPLFQTLLALALLAFAVRAYATCTALAFLLLLTRGEGAWSCAILGAACAWRAHVEGASLPLARRWRPVWVGLCMAVLYVSYHLWMFRSPTPPGARLAPFAPRDSLFLFNQHVAAPPASEWLRARLDEGYIHDRCEAALRGLRGAGFAPRSDLWFVVIGLLGAWGLGTPVGALAWAVLLLGTILSSWSNPSYFATWRAPHVMLPAAWLLNAAALARARGALRGWMSRLGLPALRWPLEGVAVVALVGFSLQTTTIYGERRVVNSFVENAAKLRRLSPQLAGKPLAAVRSWQAMADTTSPVLQIPHDGEAAMAAAFVKYEIAWLVLNAPVSELGASSGVINALLQGKRSTIGELRLERVTNPTDLPLFRVVAPAARPTR